jgi:hypothetical protein
MLIRSKRQFYRRRHLSIGDPVASLAEECGYLVLRMRCVCEHCGIKRYGVIVQLANFDSGM